jgi:hypothetical protein
MASEKLRSKLGSCGKGIGSENANEKLGKLHRDMMASYAA